MGAPWLTVLALPPFYGQLLTPVLSFSAPALVSSLADDSQELATCGIWAGATPAASAVSDRRCHRNMRLPHSSSATGPGHRHRLLAPKPSLKGCMDINLVLWLVVTHRRSRAGGFHTAIFLYRLSTKPVPVTAPIWTAGTTPPPFF